MRRRFAFAAWAVMVLLATATVAAAPPNAVLLVEQAVVEFVDPPPPPAPVLDPAASSVVASSDRVTRGKDVTVTVTLRATDGSLMPDKTVGLEANVGNVTISPTSATSNAQGVAVFTATSTVSQRVTFTAWVDGEQIPPPPPPPPPPTGDGCFADPGSCGFPDPDSGNVGVPAGKTLTDSGSITVSQAGAVIDGLNIRGTVTITANNVTIQNSKITAVSGGGFNARLITVCGGCTFTIKDSELTTMPGISYEFGIHGASNSVGGSNITMERVYQHGEIDAMLWVEGTGVVRDTYSIIGKSDGAGGWGPAIPTDHLENVYINNSTLTVDHSVILNPVPQTSTIFANTNNGFDGQPCSNRLTITNNLLAGGGQMITACAHAASAGSSSLNLSNNRIARCGGGQEVQGGGGTWLCPGLTVGANDGNGYYPRGGSFMLITNWFSSNTVWSGNVWDDNGATVPRP